jgi:hypothetical protein
MMNQRSIALIMIIAIQIAALTFSGCTEESSKSQPVLGDFAEHYLQDTKYTKLLLEIDYVEGYKPSNQALNVLKDRIDTYGDKDEIIVIDKPFSSSKSSYSQEDIRALEKENRDYENTDKIIVCYVLYLNGRFSEDENVLGVAYSASSMAIFKERIYEIGIPFWAENFIDSEDYEESVIVHEFGHLLSLVNIGYESERDHEGSNAHHCVNENSVMYHMIETASIIDLITPEGPKPPSDFGADCQHDLGKIKSGEY